MPRSAELQISWYPSIDFSVDEKKRLKDRGVLVGTTNQNAKITNVEAIGKFEDYYHKNGDNIPIDVVQSILKSVLNHEPNRERRKVDLGPDLEF